MHSLLKIQASVKAHFEEEMFLYDRLSTIFRYLSKNLRNWIPNLAKSGKIFWGKHWSFCPYGARAFLCILIDFDLLNPMVVSFFL